MPRFSFLFSFSILFLLPYTTISQSAGYKSTCAVTYDSSYSFSYVDQQGNIHVLGTLPSSWSLITGGDIAIIDNQTYWVTPGDGNDEQEDSYAYVTVQSSSKATVTSGKISNAPGYSGLPNVRELHYDNLDKQVMAIISAGNTTLLVNIENNGTISKVYENINKFWNALDWNKFGVSYYDSLTKEYTLVGGYHTQSEQLVSVSINNESNINIINVPDNIDCLGIAKWNNTFIALTMDTKTQEDMQISYYSPITKAWAPLYAYPKDYTWGSMGTLDISGDQTTLVTIVETSNGPVLSYIDLIHQKEILEVNYIQHGYSLVDIAFCETISY